MYKSPKENFSDFYNQVFEKENDAKAMLKGGIQKNEAFSQSAMKRSQFNKFEDFYNDIKANKKTDDKKQFNFRTSDNLNIRVPHDTVLHTDNKHNLSSTEWTELLNNIDNVKFGSKSHQKARYGGTPILLKVNTNQSCYGVVIEVFQKNNPIISTAFKDTEINIDNWIKVEAIPNGTETTFSDTRLNNIITHFAPNFKPMS